MATTIPTEIETLFDNIVIEQFWWDGVLVKMPFHCIYAKVPNPVADDWKEINGVKVPIIKMEKYHIPLWDPLHKRVFKMPKYAIVISHHKGNDFGLYAYPADHIDEPVVMSYQQWKRDQKNGV
ncbi:hypothetical protein [Glaciecola sp. KUL10]|jgi:hypothetical protein|uniref:hypothetical protein n=1 Tax=Glaciecola sp. (strain KUL10) TaxID=2161813 RepID=UPI000D789C1D|nr:hypothetical protein [Glaciecola sp. KUL10]GBL06028.1 hypothetical protein KUL10_33620 [Glaciecola sp. KUL10]